MPNFSIALSSFSWSDSCCTALTDNPYPYTCAPTGEALFLAKEWLKSSEGKHQIRAKAREIKGLLPGNLVTDPATVAKAKSVVLKERVALENVNIKSNFTHSLRLFQRYRASLGPEGGKSFENWIVEDQSNRKEEKSILSKWNKMKLREKSVHDRYDNAYALLSGDNGIEKKIINLINSTSTKHQRSPDFVVMLKSRHGLNIDAAIKRLRAAAADSSPPSTILPLSTIPNSAPSPTVVSCSLVRNVLGDLLYSLYAHPATVKEVRKIYDPLMEASREVDSFLRTKKGEDMITDAANEIKANGQAATMTDAKDFAAAALKVKLLPEYESSLLNLCYPFQGVEAATAAAVAVAKEMRKEARADHRKWMAMKNKQQKKVDKLSKATDEELAVTSTFLFSTSMLCAHRSLTSLHL